MEGSLENANLDILLSQNESFTGAWFKSMDRCSFGAWAIWDLGVGGPLRSRLGREEKLPERLEG